MTIQELLEAALAALAKRLLTIEEVELIFLAYGRPFTLDVLIGE